VFIAEVEALSKRNVRNKRRRAPFAVASTESCRTSPLAAVDT
jgi:hypothetical protein